MVCNRWRRVERCGPTASAVDLDALIARADDQLEVLSALHAGRVAYRRVTSAVTKPDWSSPDETRTSSRRVRVWMPWKAMIVGSVMLTVVVNVVLWLTRA
jgi:hypothetical protein